MSRPISSSSESHTSPTYPTHFSPSIHLDQRLSAYFDTDIPKTFSRVPSPLHPLDARPSNIHHGYASSYPSTPDHVASQPAPSGTSQTHFTSRESRKQKAHVASACINCKRAHLSCDIQRPCVRCVATGKQDSCVDVQHKKRGRPRLRDDRDLAAEESANEGPHRQKSTGTLPSSQTRLTAKARIRRSETYSINPQGNEGPSTLAPPSPLRTGFTYHPPPNVNIQTPYEVPMAYMDLDFVFLRANSSFERIMLGGQESRGRHLSDVALPADKSDFQSIQDRLRREREEREPSYMPPILQPGLASISGVSDGDVDRLSQGFSDHTYTWINRRLTSSDRSVFPARVRLAKANVYFVVVTLPSFRPIDPPPIPRVTVASLVPPFSRERTMSYPPEAPGPPRRDESHSAPPRMFLPSPSVGPEIKSSSSKPPHLQSTLPPPPAQLSYAPPQQPQPQVMSKTVHPPLLLQPTAEHNPALLQTPTSSDRPATSPGMLQLPSLHHHNASPMPGLSAPKLGEITRRSPGWASEGDERSSPRKRRRLGINDMLIS
ncbi:Hypothetical protein R9X50_00742900 [Acrodontium crateriforme]|uniref:Zn(2)-C6 fungal-type domain-containing protein n=1 Tax=Acrodontium crateriforme TaxID=150365 RepID=A0AAQ3MBG5_9PEZI|nr:Hypothetical protein R9X50_00742900 [Acrodontium crateriforme]